MEPRPATLITGASAGLGVEFARQCAARGDEVVLVARRKDRLEKLAAEIGGRAHVITADLSEPDAATKVVAETIDRGMWVAHADQQCGIRPARSFRRAPAHSSAGNDRSQYPTRSRNLSFVVINDMVLKGGGSILNVASTAAFQPGPNMAVYFATKAFVLSFTEALHEEWKDRRHQGERPLPGPDADRVRRRCRHQNSRTIRSPGDGSRARSFAPALRASTRIRRS